MRKKVMLLFIVVSVSSSFSQTQWTKYPNNPVLTKGPSNWDIISIGQPTCLIENDTVKIWYVGVGTDMKARICYAFSSDGINWTKYNNGAPVLDVGNTGEWDSGWLDAPEIVKGQNGYFLYYYGDTTSQSPEVSSAYGVATSPDGINWTKYASNPVFTKGNPSDWDEKWVESPAVIYDSVTTSFYMWYNGFNYSNWLIKVGLAFSPDGFNWTKYINNPVLDVGLNGSFDDMWVGTPSVIYKNNIFEMWYSGFSSVSGYDTLRIGYASSYDGINWIKYAGNPLLSTVTPPYDSLIDDNGPWAPDVIFDADSNIYKMWYEAKGGFLFAFAPDTTTKIESAVLPETAFIIYPNPFSETTTFEINDWQNQKYDIKIVNVFGKTVYQSKTLNSKSLILNLDLPNGIYFLQAIGNNLIQTKKLEIIK